MKKRSDSLTHINKSISKYVPAILLGLALVIFTGLGNTGLFDVDEAIFAEASFEMLESGDYVTPTYNGEPRYHKPPFIYWIQSASLDLFGKNAFAARLPSAVFAIATLVALFLFLEGMTKNVRFAITATSILGLNLSFFLVSHAATADMALNFFILCTTFAFLAMLYSKHRDNFAPFIGGLILAAAFLSKGPVAIMVPAVVIGLATFLKPDIVENFKRINPIYALIALFIGISPWIYLVVEAKGLDFFKEFWLVHNIGRFTEAMGNTHTTSKLYYIFVLMWGFFPWILLFPSALNWVRKGFISKLRSDNAIEALPALGLIWFVFVVGFFSFSQTKLPHYILPAYTGFALLLAGRLEHMWEKPTCKANMLWMAPYITLFAALFFILPYAPQIALGEFDKLPSVLQTIIHTFNVEAKQLEPQKAAIWLQNIQIPFSVSAIGAVFFFGALTGLCMIMRKQRQGVVVLGVSTAIALLTATHTLVPTAYNMLQGELATIGHKIKDGSTEKTNVYFVAIHQPSVRFISGKPFEKISNAEQIQVDNVHSFYVFKLERLNAVENKLKANISSKYCAGGYCLIETNKG